MIQKRTTGEWIFDSANVIFMVLLIIITGYPVFYVLVASVSNPVDVYRGSKLLLWPRGFSLETYKLVFSYPALWRSYANTIFYVVSGTAISMFLSVLGAFTLSRSYLPYRRGLTLFTVFTMYFAGGMVPSFLVVLNLKLYNTVWAVLLPGAISTFNLVIALTYFRNMPSELEDAAKIDGAGEVLTLFRIYLPLATPILAVIGLYYAVGKWNMYFQAMLYLRDRALFPLQLILREILIQNDQSMLAGSGSQEGLEAFAQNVKYASIVVATIPILCAYPFIQRYFVQGIMIGAIKG